VVDLAAESGGNVEGSIPGQDIQVPTADGQGTVTLVGLKDAASAMPADASRLYAKNLANLLALMFRDGSLAVDFDDEVVAGTCLTHDGEVRHAPTAEALAALGAAPAAAPPGETESRGSENHGSENLEPGSHGSENRESENEGVV
jgi:NAD(P) transhydrogenase subunit alpha